MSIVSDRVGDRRRSTEDRQKRGPAQKFSRRRAIEMLAHGMSQTKVAEVLGVSQPAVSVFQKREDVRGEIEALRAGAREAGRSRLVGMVRSALDTLDEIVNDRGCEPRDRIAAAKEILARVYDVEVLQATTAMMSEEDYELARRFLEARDARETAVDARQ